MADTFTIYMMRGHTPPNHCPTALIVKGAKGADAMLECVHVCEAEGPEDALRQHVSRTSAGPNAKLHIQESGKDAWLGEWQP